MPDVSLMLDLCNILGITVNELLSRKGLGGLSEKSRRKPYGITGEKRKSTRRIQFYIENFDCNFQFIFCA